MTITITEDDIQNGRRCDPDCCPVGRAIARAGLTHLGVFGPEVMLADGQDHASGFPLPESVKSWILAFDGHQPVYPITFELPDSVPATLPAH